MGKNKEFNGLADAGDSLGQGGLYLGVSEKQAEAIREGIDRAVENIAMAASRKGRSLVIGVSAEAEVPAHGSFVINGQYVLNFGAVKMQDRISLVFFDPNLETDDLCFHDTNAPPIGVLDDGTVKIPDVVDAVYMNVLGLDVVRAILPNGYDDLVRPPPGKSDPLKTQEILSRGANRSIPEP